MQEAPACDCLEPRNDTPGKESLYLLNEWRFRMHFLVVFAMFSYLLEDMKKSYNLSGNSI